jgi:hypothetical protein
LEAIAMKNKTRAVSAVLISMVAVLLLAGCPLFMPVMKTGQVSLTLGSGGGAKTILPTVTVASYLISFSGPVAKASVSTSDSNPTIELEVGTWDISVEGKDSGGKTVAVGSANDVVVTAGATTPVSIMLSAQSSGNGTIDVTVTWPAEESVDQPVTVTLDGSAVDGATLSAGTTWVRYLEDKPAESYILCFILKKNGVQRACVQEAVQVYMNLTSSATIALTTSDFSHAPAAPTGLSVSEGLGKLVLHWTDNSHVETGYTVERGTDGITYGVIGSISAPATSYDDTTAAIGQTYYYQVRATNDFGASDPSGSASGKVEAPVPGGGGVLTFGGVTSSSIRVSWQKATDSMSAQTALTYKVVRSLSNNVQTVGDAEANGTVVQDWTADIATANATGLSAETTYYFNVLVRDEAGQKAVYAMRVQSTTAPTGTIIADHTIMTLVKEDRIPESAIQHAKDTLRVAYEHASHGEQPIQGMTGLIPFKESLGGTPGLYDWNQVDNWGSDVVAGKMNIDDFFYSMGAGFDLEYYPDWVYATRKYLGWICGSGDGSVLTDYATGTPNYNSVANVLIWSWCAFTANQSVTDQYLAAMDQLVANYPQVTFVYMTAHANGTGYYRDDIPIWNAYIAQHCIAHNQVLYDFYDIECYDLDGNYFGDKHVDASCAYDKVGVQDGNWGIEYQTSHVQDVDWYWYPPPAKPSHTEPVNANQKAYAWWWMLARIAGWDGTPVP